MEVDTEKQIFLQVSNETSLSKEKFLIVVGRMGHGKSSFCKMIVDDSEKGKIKAEADVQSVTLESNFYVSNRFDDIFDGKINVLDTPGLDSQASVSKVIEDIDSLVMQHNGEIVAIAYVLDIHAREKGQDGKNYIFNFLQFLRIRRYYKNKLTFCILSRFDRHFDLKKTNAKLIGQMQKLFQQHGYSQIWQRKIMWISEPSQDEGFYEKLQNTDILSNLYKNQFVVLKNILKSVADNKHCLTYQTYMKDRQQFEIIFTQALIRDYSSFNHKNVTEQFDVAVEISKNSFKQNVVKACVSLQIGGLTTIGSIVTGSAAAAAEVGVGGAIAAGTLSTAAAIALPIILGVASIGLIGFGVKKIWNRYMPKIQSGVSQQEIQKIVSNIIEQKLKICLISAVTQWIQLNGCEVTFKNPSYIVNMKAFDENNKPLEVEKIIMNEDTVFKTQLKLGKNRLNFIYKLPVEKSSEQYLKKSTISFYNDEKF